MGKRIGVFDRNRANNIREEMEGRGWALVTVEEKLFYQNKHGQRIRRKNAGRWLDKNPLEE